MPISSSITTPRSLGYTKQIGDKIIANIPKFLRLRDVSQSVGVRYGTMVNWLQKGSHPGSPADLADFAYRFAIAESDFQAECLKLALEPWAKLRFNDIRLSDLAVIMGGLPNNILTPSYNKIVENAVKLAKKDAKRKIKSNMTVSIEFLPSKTLHWMIENRWRFTDKDLTAEDIFSSPTMGSREEMLNNPTPAMRALLDRTGWVRREAEKLLNE